jgi:hypothetical protein
MVVALSLAGLGCTAPEHLTDSHGVSYHEALTRQAIRPPGESAEPVTGLDSLEAAIISESYLQSLAAKGQSLDEEDQTLLYVAPRPRNAQKPLPPPSVPEEEGRRQR